jgi:hypothetical protein
MEFKIGDTPAIIRHTTLVGTGGIAGDMWTVPVVKESGSAVTCLFQRWQFPSEWYTMDFDRETGKCLDARITCVRLQAGTKQTEMFGQKERE